MSQTFFRRLFAKYVPEFGPLAEKQGELIKAILMPVNRRRCKAKLGKSGEHMYDEKTQPNQFGYKHLHAS